jgi:hypothetical protein
MASTLHRTLEAVLVLAGAAAPLAAQNVSVGGVVYAQYAAQLDSAPRAPGSNSNFDVTRAYLNVIGRFAGGILTRVTGDIYRNNDTSSAGSLSYRLKYAYFAWTPDGSPLTYKFGLTQTPWLDWEEALWDYRMQGPDPVDRNKYMSSADFGLGVDGRFGADRLNFQAMAMNGENYNKAPGDQGKDYAARVSFRLLDTDDSSRLGGLRVTGYGQLGKPTGGGRRNRFIAMASYRSKALTLAGEYVATSDSAGGGANVSGRIISAFGVFHIPSSQLAVIGRVDLLDPNTADSSTATSNDRRTTIIVGVSYQLSPNVRLLADIDNTTLQGSVSGSATAPRKLTQVALHTQFTF